MVTKRAISHSEISTMYDCQAKWDFSYGGHLVGDTLKRREPHIRLREGRAWGRAVAALHGSQHPTLLGRSLHALSALNDALQRDADKLRKHGLYSATDQHDMQIRLAEMLWHYASTSEPLELTDPEIELRVPIPSRTGRGPSNRYVFHGYLDGLIERHVRLFIVEYKLRDQLSDYEQITRNRQIRRYAWGAERALERPIAGVIVDERLNAVPKPARWVNGRKKNDGRVPSHAKEQLTTAVLYREACAEAGVEVSLDTEQALDQRRWQVRHPPVLFRRDEIEEAGRELVSAAHLIAQLDAGVLHPVRNSQPRLCAGCAFKNICVRPRDRELVDTHFERGVPKRLRTSEESRA